MRPDLNPDELIRDADAAHQRFLDRQLIDDALADEQRVSDELREVLADIARTQA